ncbi:thioredoxin family protein [Leucothrix arctica]|uniref:Thioredoxin n=1 Tax=Leucothrix arctica TaxID=1481894 RepID=A0A317CEJ8_9GAMM|nr:thioredoxin family protein [Leucothrix arctica]PWQ96946.1 thioredoxin [Leucothrix arctica]
MKRRTFIGLVAGLTLAPSLLFAGTELIYTPGLIKEKLAEGKTVFVDYAASWCSTCKRQERVRDQLRESNPEYDKNLVFIRVEWDVYNSHAVTTDRNIPRRSTLLVLRGDKELGRIVSGTSVNEIKALMDKGIAKES